MASARLPMCRATSLPRARPASSRFVNRSNITRSSARECAPLYAPRPIAHAVLSCAPLCARPPIVMRRCACAPRFAYVAPAPTVLPPNVLRVSTRRARRANVAATLCDRVVETRSSRSRACAPILRLFPAVAGSRPIGAPSTIRWQWPVPASVLHVCRGGCDASPRARTRPPACSAPFPRADRGALFVVSASQA